jgi:predicted nuclease with RNAse H fold
MEAGDDVFRRLEDNSPRLEVLVAEIHPNEGLEPPLLHKQAKRKRRNEETAAVPESGVDHIIAASVLCQLAAPEAAWEQGKSGSSKQPHDRDPSKLRMIVLGTYISP